MITGKYREKTAMIIGFGSDIKIIEHINGIERELKTDIYSN